MLAILNKKYEGVKAGNREGTAVVERSVEGVEAGVRTKAREGEEAMAGFRRELVRGMNFMD